MGSLVSTLDAERWSAVDVSPERQADLDRLTAGKAVLVSSTSSSSSSQVMMESGITNRIRFVMMKANSSMKLR